MGRLPEDYDRAERVQGIIDDHPGASDLTIQRDTGLDRGRIWRWRTNGRMDTKHLPIFLAYFGASGDWVLMGTGEKYPDGLKAPDASAARRVAMELKAEEAKEARRAKNKARRRRGQG